MEQENVFGLVDPEFYEPLSRYALNPTYTDFLQQMLPANWAIFRRDIWMHSSGGGMVRQRQGFKIHVSATPQTALRVLELVVPVCVEAGLNFKIAGDPYLLELITSKSYARGYSGKFMTIYPSSDEEFASVIEAIYQRTAGADVAGPYILSDSRYKDSSILYYRYGGFLPHDRLRCDGSRTSLLSSPTGEEVPDERIPEFRLPSWVANPFKPTSGLSASEDGDVLLKGCYRVDGVFSFSNAGGVYFGRSMPSEQAIVIKEARPYTNNWRIGEMSWDAVDLLKRESQILEMLRGVDCVPAPIDLFSEWEHTFLVQQRVNGNTLNTYWSRQDFVLAPHIRRPGVVEGFLKVFRQIAVRLLDMVEAIHKRGVIIGDISPQNILIAPTTLDMWIIDFEWATVAGDSKELQEHSVQWATPGFTNPRRKLRGYLLPEDDYYSVAMTLYNSVVPANNLFKIHPGAKELFLRRFIDLGVPETVAEILQSLEAGQVSVAREMLSELDSPRSSVLKNGSRESTLHMPSQEDLRSGIEEMAEYTLQAANYERRDRLWPADFRIFSSHPLNVAYGACGTALFLRQATGAISESVSDWIQSCLPSVEECPPGLYLGLAGIAYTLDRLGDRQNAEKVMAATYESPILFDEPGMFLGASGWGWASLYFYAKTRSPLYIERAVRAGEWLLGSAESKGDGCCWRNGSEGRIHYGYGYGSSGVGLFLLNLARFTGRTEFESAAIRALEHDLSTADMTKSGKQWKRFENDVMHYPYWIHGNAGIGSTVIRFAAATGSARYERIAREIAESTFLKYTYNAGLFEGLTGIGEFMLDMYLYTRERSYLDKAFDIAETLLWFRMERPSGAAYPGRWLRKVSTDYGTGSAGIGLFFDRLLKPRARDFVDLDSWTGVAG